jgi:hypothetical protein
MEPVLDWEARYQAASVPWERDGLNPAFTAWLPWLEKQQGSVLVPGCGRSPEMRAFADLGFYAVGIDLAESAARFQEAALTQSGGRGEVVTSNLFDWLPETPVRPMKHSSPAGCGLGAVCLYCSCKPARREALLFTAILMLWLNFLRPTVGFGRTRPCAQSTPWGPTSWGIV